MNSYFLEILMKERQKQISEEFKQIHMSRVGRNRSVGFLKKIILGFGEVLLPWETA